MSESLVVLLEGRVAGVLTRLPAGRLRFDYDEEYRNQAQFVPLSVSMPKQVRSHTDGAITPWLWGLLPDNDAVLDRWARQFHASASSPFSLLGTPIGEDCPGAVQLASPDVADALLHRAGDVAWLTEDEVAARLRDLREDATSWLGRSFVGQFSLAGAQAKTALLFQDGRWGVPSGAAATTHILKPAVAGLDDHDLNEHLCLDAARRAGLVAARSRIGRFGAESAIVVERYDRREAGGAIRRVHQEDLCQALGVAPTRKYQNEGGPGPAEIVALFRNVMPSRVAEESVWRFIDALAWNWVIGGTDAHAKNYSVLLAGAAVRMAPLYDVASGLPYGVHERRLRFAMKLGGRYDVFPHHNPWPRVADELGVARARVVARVRDLAGRAPDALSDAAAVPDVAELRRELATRLVDLVADRAQRCVSLLDAGRSG